MADTKISDLPAVTDVQPGDEYVLARTGFSKKITAADLLAGSSGLPESGWVAAGETWTYASADDPTFTFTISGDLTTKYSAGMKVLLTQTTDKFFFITKVTHSSGTTTVTIFGGTDYDLANASITLPYYSVVKAPFGFPLDPTKWTVEYRSTTNATQASPTASTWYNLGSASISIPIGVWDVHYEACPYFQDSTNSFWDMITTLSTGNNTETDVDWSARIFGGEYKQLLVSLYRRKVIALTAKTTYYLNAMTVQTGEDAIIWFGSTSPTLIRAVCAYL